MQGMVSAMEKNKTEHRASGMCVYRGNVVLFYILGVQERPSDKVIFEKEPKGSEGASFTEIREKQFQIEKNHKYKGPRAQAWWTWGTGRRPV